MTLDRRKRILFALLLVAAMLVCGFFSLRHGPHREAFRLAYTVILLLNFWLQYRYNLNRPQRDTITHLFPPPTQSSQERL